MVSQIKNRPAILADAGRGDVLLVHLEFVAEEEVRVEAVVASVFAFLHGDHRAQPDVALSLDSSR